MSESIYAWIAPDPVVPEKPALYRSTHAHNAPLVGSTIKVVKGAHSHLGQTRAQLMATVQPENYLRARQNSGRAMDASVLPPPHHKTVSKVPPVPRMSDFPPRAKYEAKDFVSENAIKAITMQPKPRAAPGPNWLSRDGAYGKVPAYLANVKEEIEAEREFILNLLDAQQMQAEAEAGGSTRELGDDERAELLDALKSKWDAVNAKYQVQAHKKVSTATSSLGEIRAKESGEAAMRALEADIRKLSVAGPIFVTQ